MPKSNLAQKAIAWTARRMRERVPYSPENHYLEGAYAPAPAECHETELKVTGHIPEALNGLYARIGPNPIRVANPAVYHWFAGDGMVHGLRLRDGRALDYRSRWVGSDSAQRALGRARAPGPRAGLSDVVNTNLIGHGGKIWALVESGMLPVELDGELNTVRHGLFDSDRVRAFTAHPHHDPDSGELHAICYDAQLLNRIHYLRINPVGQIGRLVDIPVRHGPMIHDCAITSKYVVILDLPVTFSFRELLRGGSFPYRWNARHGARVGLLPREGSAEDIRWCEVDPCYVFHTCNAYDLPDGRVALDAVVHNRMFDRSRIGPEREHSGIGFERWIVDPVAGGVERRPWSDRPQEFPRLDERLTGKPYRYAYSIAVESGIGGARHLLRHDLSDGSCIAHDYGPGRVTGEAVFVPRHAAAGEDEGWLLSYVYDAATDRSALVILDAQNFAGEPQAVVHLPARVPLGFHGNWIADPA